MSKHMIDLPRLQADFICCLESACNQQTLIELKNKWIKQNLNPLYDLLQNTESAHKPLVGKQINELKAFIEVQLKFFFPSVCG